MKTKIPQYITTINGFDYVTLTTLLDLVEDELELVINSSSDVIDKFVTIQQLKTKRDNIKQMIEKGTIRGLYRI